MAQRSCALQVSVGHRCFQRLGHPRKVFVENCEQLSQELLVVVYPLAQRCLIPHGLSQGAIVFIHGFTSILVVATRDSGGYDLDNLIPPGGEVENLVGYDAWFLAASVLVTTCRASASMLELIRRWASAAAPMFTSNSSLSSSYRKSMAPPLARKSGVSPTVSTLAPSMAFNIFAYRFSSEWLTKRMWQVRSDC